MSCFSLLYTRDYACQNPTRKYLQQVILIKLSDVLDYVVSDKESSGQYRIQIDLSQNTPLHSLRYNPKANLVFGSFQKSIKNDLVHYKHQIQIGVFDVSEATKIVLRAMDKATYFACLMYQNQVIEVYGFHYGLTSANYNYDPANNGGGGTITLESITEEHNMPYVLHNNSVIKKTFLQTGTPFNQVRSIPDNPVGFGQDFNQDFDRHRL